MRDAGHCQGADEQEEGRPVAGVCGGLAFLPGDQIDVVAQSFEQGLHSVAAVGAEPEHVGDIARVSFEE